MTPEEELAFERQAWASIARNKWQAGMAVGIFFGFWVGAVVGPLMFK